MIKAAASRWHSAHWHATPTCSTERALSANCAPAPSRARKMTGQADRPACTLMRVRTGPHLAFVGGVALWRRAKLDAAAYLQPACAELAWEGRPPPGMPPRSCVNGKGPCRDVPAHVCGLHAQSTCIGVRLRRPCPPSLPAQHSSRGPAVGGAAASGSVGAAGLRSNHILGSPCLYLVASWRPGTPRGGGLVPRHFACTVSLPRAH